MNLAIHVLCVAASDMDARACLWPDRCTMFLHRTSNSRYQRVSVVRHINRCSFAYTYTVIVGALSVQFSEL